MATVTLRYRRLTKRSADPENYTMPPISITQILRYFNNKRLLDGQHGRILGGGDGIALLNYYTNKWQDTVHSLISNISGGLF